MTNRVSIEIRPIEGRYSVSQKREFMKRATDAMVTALGCSPSEVVVRIEESRAENVSRAGVSFSRRD